MYNNSPQKKVAYLTTEPQGKEIYSSLLTLLGVLAEDHPQSSKLIEVVKNGIKDKSLMSGDLIKKTNAIVQAVRHENDVADFNRRSKICDFQKQLTTVLESEHLSHDQSKKIDELDLDDENSINVLEDLVSLLSEFSNSIIELRSQVKPIVDSNEEKNGLKNNIIENDVVWSSKRMIKSMIPVLKGLHKHNPDDTELLNYVKKAIEIETSTKLNYFDVIDLIESVSCKLVVLQSKQNAQEIEYLKSFQSHLNEVNQVLAKTLKENSKHNENSKREEEAFLSMLDNFSINMSSEQEPHEIKKTLTENISTIKTGFTNFAERQSLYIRQQDRKIEKLNISIKSKEKEHESLIKEREELDSAIQLLAKKSNKDDLTGFFNRRSYNEKVAKINKSSNKNWSFVVIDIDHFKVFNDTYGHAIGDKVLKLVAKTIDKLVKKLLKYHITPYRYGGEEFVLLTESNIVTAKTIARLINKTLDDLSFMVKQERVKITVSCGVAAFSIKETTCEDVFQKADEALYKAKKLGRNRVVAYNEKSEKFET